MCVPSLKLQKSFTEGKNTFLVQFKNKKILSKNFQITLQTNESAGHLFIAGMIKIPKNNGKKNRHDQKKR